jgi:hypothetical protein
VYNSDTRGGLVKILLGLVIYTLLLVGCSTTEPPVTILIPTSTPISTSTPIPVDERAVLIETLTSFNTGSNAFYEFLSESTSIEWLEGSPKQKSFVTTLVIIGGLNVYKQSVSLWNPPKLLSMSTYDELIDMKEAELYRVKTFTEILQMLQNALTNGSDDQIIQEYENLSAWSESMRNNKSIYLQMDLLKKFSILSEEVNFERSLPPEKKSDDLLREY